MFEIRDHDGAGRLGVFSVNGKKVITPNIAVVINPNNMIISPDEMAKEFGIDLIITNAYIIKNSKKRKEIEKQGLHKYLNFNGIIYTDSGTYQMYSKGNASITNFETLSYQELIGSDIHTPLDLFTLPADDKETARKNLEETIRRIKKIKSRNFSAPIQGGSYLDLRKKGCRELSKINPTVYAIGGIVPYMINYDFVNLIRVVATCKENLPLGVPVHAFGAGHPLVFALLAYAGVDLFDSASYALYAQQGRYITETGTKNVKDLVSLPCNCPVCSTHSPKDLIDEGLLARHNLYAIMREIKVVREAIQEDRLFELVSSRARSHPAVYYGFKELLKHRQLLRMSDPVRKRNALFWTGPLSDERPEINYAMERVREMGFRKVPLPLKLVYPFGQSSGWKINYSAKKYDDYSTLKLILDYQFGKGAGDLLPRNIRIVRTKNRRINKVLYNDKLLFVLRARDGYAALHKEGVLLFRKYVKKVKANGEFREFYEKGSDVFAKHVIKADNIKPREEVAVYCGRKLVAVGEAVLSGREMLELSQGVAVKVREGLT